MVGDRRLNPEGCLEEMNLKLISKGQDGWTELDRLFQFN